MPGPARARRKDDGGGGDRLDRADTDRQGLPGSVQQHPRGHHDAHVIEHAVQRARVDPAEVEDVIIGCAMPEGATGHNIARQAALRAGLPVTAAGTTINRFCSSGLQAIALAAQRVIVDRVPVAVAGGVESISLVQNEHQNRFRLTEDWLLEHKPEVYMSMLETAEVVAKRYGVTREMQDALRPREPAPDRGRPARGPARRRDRAAQVRQDRDRQGQRTDARGVGDPRPRTKATAPTPPPRASPR